MNVVCMRFVFQYLEPIQETEVLYAFAITLDRTESDQKWVGAYILSTCTSLSRILELQILNYIVASKCLHFALTGKLLIKN